jgi:hypothetical protein
MNSKVVGLAPGILSHVRKLRATNVDWYVHIKIFVGKTRGRCYDHNFLRFLTIFGEKNGVFSKTNVMIKLLHNLALFQVKNANFFAKIFGENILKIITSVPGIVISFDLQALRFKLVGVRHVELKGKKLNWELSSEFFSEFVWNTD